MPAALIDLEKLKFSGKCFGRIPRCFADPRNHLFANPQNHSSTDRIRYSAQLLLKKREWMRQSKVMHKSGSTGTSYGKTTMMIIAAIFAYVGIPAALVLGAVQLMAPKGTLPHRAVGWIWMCLTLGVAVSLLLVQISFFIQISDKIRIFLRAPLIDHLLAILMMTFAVLSLIVLPLGVWRAHQHRVQDHRRAMMFIYFAGLVLTGLTWFRAMYAASHH